MAGDSLPTSISACTAGKTQAQAPNWNCTRTVQVTVCHILRQSPYSQQAKHCAPRHRLALCRQDNAAGSSFGCTCHGGGARPHGWCRSAVATTFATTSAPSGPGATPTAPKGEAPAGAGRATPAKSVAGMDGTSTQHTLANLPRSTKSPDSNTTSSQTRSHPNICQHAHPNPSARTGIWRARWMRGG
jgi:hypothetical protein